MQVYSHWLAKRGNSAEEYEDACAGNPKAGRFAIADGATESVFAAAWAKLLVKHFVQRSEDDVAGWVASVQSAQAEWPEDVKRHSFPWYTEMKVGQGDFATFLGLTLTTGQSGTCRWQAVAVGDSCLFHTRGDNLLRTFPIESSSKFENSPPLVGSRTPADLLRGRATCAAGMAVAEDRLWLMTDAMSQWFLLEHESGARPWTSLERLMAPQGHADSFASWIEGLRDAKRLRNDDVTLLMIRL